jgi:hypothetical protein
MDFQRWQSKTIMPGEGWHSDKQSGSGLLRTWLRRALAAPRARLEAGAGARAGQASQPPARAGQAWGARLEARLGRAPGGQAGARAWRPGRAPPRGTGLGRAPGGRGELPRAGQACQPPARAGQAWGARLEAGAGARAGQACQPPARAGQAWGARLEAGASSRARGRQRVRQRRQCQCIRQRVLVHAGHGMGAGLGQWTFQGGKTQLSRERDVHGAHVDACTVYLLRVLIMAAIPP